MRSLNPDIKNRVYHYMEQLEGLLKSPVFKGLDYEALEHAIKSVRWQIKSYDKGSSIAYRGDDVSNLLIILKGEVHGVMIGPDGKYVKIEDVAAPRPIGTGFMYGKHHFFPVDVIANTDVKVFLIPRDDFGHMMTQNPVVQTNFLNLISNRAQFLTSKIRLLSRKSIRAKLAQIIIEQDDQRRGKVVNSLSQQNAADLIGVARPSLARTFGEFLDEGIIEGSWKEFTIVHYRTLEGFLFE